MGTNIIKWDNSMIRRCMMYQRVGWREDEARLAKAQQDAMKKKRGIVNSEKQDKQKKHEDSSKKNPDAQAGMTTSKENTNVGVSRNLNKNNPYFYTGNMVEVSTSRGDTNISASSSLNENPDMPVIFGAGLGQAITCEMVF